MRLDGELVENHVQLVSGCLLERRRGVGKHRARIHPVFAVEEGGEQIVAEIVVGGDMALRALLGIALQRVQCRQRPAAQAGRTVLHAIVDAFDVAREEPDQADQIVDVPGAVHVCLGDADGAAEGETPPHVRVTDDDVDVDGRRGRGRLAELANVCAFA